MNKWTEILMGLILILAPVLVALKWAQTWGKATIIFLEGGVISFVVLIGILFLILGISDLKG